jgi:hypothetical protein
MSIRPLSGFTPVSLLLAAAYCMLFSQFAGADSQARIVRLSDVQGSVQIDKNTGLGFETAFLNLPVTQGTQLRTRGDGRAEIEFEDGSTLRLAPNTTVLFSNLSLSDAGHHFSVVDLHEGMAYVNWLGKNGDEFSLNFSREKISLDHSAHFRVDVSSESSNLAVFKGDVNVEGPSGKITVAKNKTATFAGSDDAYTLANKIAESPLDAWDNSSIAYHEQYAKNNVSPYEYGMSDLMYYGSFVGVPGYGMMWQPYFTGVGWDPFMDGAWGWYPGYGYMFASPYPWGWLPYHYGNWNFVPARGWMWQPGGWNNWLAVPHYTATSLAHVSPLVVPTGGTVKTVVVGKGGSGSPLTLSHLVVNAGSAGMSIPRGSIDGLGHLNHQVAKSGFADLHAMPQFSTTSSGRSFGSGFGSSSMASASGHASSSGGHASGGGGHR